MPDTIIGIISLAEQLVKDIKKHNEGADTLVNETQTLCSRVEGLKQYEEEIVELNSYKMQRPRSSLLMAMHRENSYMKQLKNENAELKNALDEHQRALEMIMCKYREHVTKLINQNKQDRLSSQQIHVALNVESNKRSLENVKLQNKICEMASVMKKAITCDISSSHAYQQEIKDLQMQNENLRSLVGISKLKFNEVDHTIGTMEQSSTTEDESSEEEEEEEEEEDDDDGEVEIGVDYSSGSLFSKLRPVPTPMTKSSVNCGFQSGGGFSENFSSSEKSLDYVSQLNSSPSAYLSQPRNFTYDQEELSDTETLHENDDSSAVTSTSNIINDNFVNQTNSNNYENDDDQTTCSMLGRNSNNNTMDLVTSTEKSILDVLDDDSQCAEKNDASDINAKELISNNINLVLSTVDQVPNNKESSLNCLDTIPCPIDSVHSTKELSTDELVLNQKELDLYRNHVSTNISAIEKHDTNSLDTDHILNDDSSLNSSIDSIPISMKSDTNKLEQDSNSTLLTEDTESSDIIDLKVSTTIPIDTVEIPDTNNQDHVLNNKDSQQQNDIKIQNHVSTTIEKTEIDDINTQEELALKSISETLDIVLNSKETISSSDENTTFPIPAAEVPISSTQPSILNNGNCNDANNH